MLESKPMRYLRTFSLLGFCVALPAIAADHTPPPVQPATAFAAVETHDDEKLSIAAEPYDTKEKAAIFRVDYLSHNVMPVRLIVTNNSSRPISLRDARILFQTAAGDRIQAAEPEDVERMMDRSNWNGVKPPLPSPIPGVHLPRRNKNKDKDIQADFDTFEYGALAVEPHTTRAGFLFYDVSGLTDPLRGAKLHLHDLRDADGKQLFYFEISLDKRATSGPAAVN